MTPHPAPTTPRADAPTPAARVLVALVLRLTLGLTLLDEGVRHYLLEKLASSTPVARNFYGSPVVYPYGATPSPPPTVPGWEAFAGYLPYAEVAVGVAVALGFFTTAAATLAALWPLLLRVLKLGYVLAVVPLDPTASPALVQPDDAARALPLLLLAVAVIWLSSSGTNPMSLDALVRRRAAARPAPGRGRVTAAGIPDVPAVGSVNPIQREFDPELAVGGLESKGDS